MDITSVRSTIRSLSFGLVLSLLLAACGDSASSVDTEVVDITDGESSSDADVTATSTSVGTEGVTGACSLNSNSVRDRVVEEAAAGFDDLLSSLEVPSVSPVVSGIDDLQVDMSAPADGETVSVVVRKPVLDNLVHRITSIPGDPQVAWSYVKGEIEQAVEEGATQIVFPLNAKIKLQNPNNSAGAQLPLEDLTDVDIDLNGSVIEYPGIAVGLVIKNSQRVRIHNGTIKGSELIASIAEVVYDDSPGGVSFRLKPVFAAELEALYLASGDRPDLLTAGKAEVDGDSWRIKALGNIDVFINRGSQYNNFVFRSGNETADGQTYFQSTSALSVEDDLRFDEGQLVYLLHQNNAGHAIVLKNDDGDVEDITFEDLTLMNIPGMGIAGEVNRGIHVNRVVWTRDPDNPVSFLGSSSDAFHINNNGGDIVFENNSIAGAADDLFTAKGNWWRLKSMDRAENTLVVERAGEKRYSVQIWSDIGERVVFIDETMQLTGTATTALAAKELSGGEFEVTLNAVPDGVSTGMLVANPDRAGGRVIIRNNRFASTRAQGILAQTQHMVITDNEFENIAGPAIKLNFGLNEWYEAVVTRNIAIKDNLFDTTAVGATKPPYSLYISQTNEGGEEISIIEHVKIEGNRFVDTNRFGNCAANTRVNQTLFASIR